MSDKHTGHAMWKLEVSTVGDGTCFVDAYKHGKFIVHLPVGQSIADNPDYAPEALWVISHRVTGRAIWTIQGRAHARRLARALDAATEADITLDDYTNKTPAWKVFGKAVSGIVKQDKAHADG